MFRETKSEKRAFFEGMIRPSPACVPELIFNPPPALIFLLAVFVGALYFLRRNFTLLDDNLRYRNHQEQINLIYNCNFTQRPFDEVCDEIYTQTAKYNEEISKADNRIFVSEILIGISIVLFTCLILRAKYLAAKNKSHPHHFIARGFYDKNPIYPQDKNKNIEIQCPISRERSKHAVCLSYQYNDRLYEHAYDYEELKKYFLTVQGTKCPITGVNLLHPTVKKFKISFDIPDHVSENVNNHVQTLNPYC